MNYKAYFFDFDYTLADSSKGIVKCFRRVLERHQHTNISDEEIKRTIGKTLEESFSILTNITSAEILASYRQEYSKESSIYMNANTVLYPDTIKVLKQLKKEGAYIGIISTKHRYRISDYLKEHFPKDFFDIIIGGEDVTKHKPSPEGLISAIEQLNIRKEEALYIGDSIVDAEAAKAAGIDFVGVTSGVTTREELQSHPNKMIIKRLKELLEINMGDKYRLVKTPFPIKRYQPIARALHIKQIKGSSKILFNADEVNLCKNCGKQFTGNYCGYCGQSKETPRFNFHSGAKNMFGGLSNIDHGFWHTLINLAYRPGYMISDFIAGKRVSYFRPFQTLFVLAAIYIMIAQLVAPDLLTKKREKDTSKQSTAITNNKSNSINSQDNYIIDINGKNLFQKKEVELTQTPIIGKVYTILKNWSEGNKAAGIIFILPFFALAARLAFRKAKNNNHYNYTEHIFVQTYISSQILLFSIFYLVINGTVAINDIYDLPVGIIFLLFLWDYKQLFRDNWIITLKNTLLMFFYASVGIIITMIIAVTIFIGTTEVLKS